MRVLHALLPLFLLLSRCSSGAAPPANAPPAPAPNSAAGTAPASAAGTSPAASKAGPLGALCGGIAGFGCAEGGYCAYPPDAQCGAADQSGKCEPVPTACTKEFRPVCGCDDKTYANACVAASARVSARKPGECP